MKNIFENVPKKFGNGKAIAICFFFLAGCMFNDESLIEGDHHDDFISDDLSTEIVSEANDVSSNSKKNFTAHLSGANEVPAVNLDGQGQVIFKLNNDETELHYKLIVANIENVTQAHIHCGVPGLNGPVVVFLFGFNPAGVNDQGAIAEGTITSANIIARGSSAACMGGLATFENLVARMRNGSVYVNVHTKAFPGGEIRGQIK